MKPTNSSQQRMRTMPTGGNWFAAYAAGVGLLLTGLAAPVPAAETVEGSGFSVGARVQSLDWQIKQKHSQQSSTGTSSSDEVSSSAASAGVILQWRRQRFFLGGSLSAASFVFNGASYPRADGDTTTNSDGNTIVGHSELDIVAGYNFWRPLAFYINSKVLQDNWADGYFLRYMGLGAGASYHHTYSTDWSLFATGGLMPIAVEDSNGIHGRGAGAGVEVSAVYAVNPRNLLSLGMKTQLLRTRLDANETQQHQQINGLLLRYYHVF